MPKAQPLYTGAKSNLRDRIWGEVQKNSFIALPGKGGHSGLLPSQTMCSNPGEFGEEFYGKGSRVRVLIRFGCVQGLHSFNLVSGNILLFYFYKFTYFIYLFLAALGLCCAQAFSSCGEQGLPQVFWGKNLVLIPTSVLCFPVSFREQGNNHSDYFLLKWGIILSKFRGIDTELEIFELQVLDLSLI